MTRIEITNKFEKALVWFLNLDGWRLEWIGDKNLCYDAKGYTPKGVPCVMEMKFRKKYYDTKMLEKKKFENLMKLPEEVVKIYFVSDPKGSYYYWLNKLREMEVFDKSCPATSYWNDNKMSKEVYLLTEKEASIVHKN